MSSTVFSPEEKIHHHTLNTSPSWTSFQKIGFRFVFLMLGFFIIMENNEAFPFWDFLMMWFTEVLHVVIPWIGKHILQLSYDITVFTNGSGDTTYDYVIVLSIFCLAVIGTIIWSLIDRNRKNYDTLYYWLTVAVRFYVGLMLISYGLIKVFKLQFPYPGINRLTQPYGLSTPMGLAWTFLGFSKGYNLFMGIAEVAAVLLLFRRTVTLGALITLGTTANVMAVNYFYDVPVKILSTALFLMTCFLLSHEARRLFQFFVQNMAVKLQPLSQPVISKRWLRISLLTFKFLVIGYVLFYGAFQSYQSLSVYGDRAPKPFLYGMYNVKSHSIKSNGAQTVPGDDVHWKRLIIQWEQYAAVGYKNDSTKGFVTKIDTLQRTMDFTARRDTTLKYHFRYEMPDPEHFVLKGTTLQDSAEIYFDRHTDVEKMFKLTNRGFHWINEYPYNR